MLRKKERTLLPKTDNPQSYDKIHCCIKLKCIAILLCMNDKCSLDNT